MRRQYADNSRSQSPGFPLPWAVGFLAIGTLGGGLCLLWQHSQSADPVPFRATSGLLLAMLGGAQIRLVLEILRRTPRQPTRSARSAASFLEWLIGGVVLCYAAGLAWGPEPGLEYLFLAVTATWFTALLAIFAMQPQLPGRNVGWRRTVAHFGHLACAPLILFVVLEGSLRVYDLVADDRIGEVQVAKAHCLIPGGLFRGRQVNSAGYCDQEFDRQPRPGIVRIAVLGDSMLLSGSDHSNCLQLLEQRLPGIDIYNFAIPDAGPREYAAQLTHEVLKFQPDLVLTFISIGDDLTSELPVPGAFDWRSLQLYQRSVGMPSGASRQQELYESSRPTREAYLRSLTGRLAVCRTPIDEAMNRRWSRTIGYLGDIADACQEHGIAAALVLVPAEFQINRDLCQSLSRQAGYQTEQLDLDLPQRRLAVFGDDRLLPVLDLLPHFRNSEPLAFSHNASEWNDHGNQLVAQVVGQWLRDRYNTLIASATP